MGRRRQLPTGVLVTRSVRTGASRHCASTSTVSMPSARTRPSRPNPSPKLKLDCVRPSCAYPDRCSAWRAPASMQEPGRRRARVRCPHRPQERGQFRRNRPRSPCRCGTSACRQEAGLAVDQRRHGARQPGRCRRSGEASCRTSHDALAPDVDQPILLGRQQRVHYQRAECLRLACVARAVQRAL